jgi:hypothetical protein
MIVTQPETYTDADGAVIIRTRRDNGQSFELYTVKRIRPSWATIPRLGISGNRYGGAEFYRQSAGTDDIPLEIWNHPRVSELVESPYLLTALRSRMYQLSDFFNFLDLTLPTVVKVKRKQNEHVVKMIKTLEEEASRRVIRCSDKRWSRYRTVGANLMLMFLPDWEPTETNPVRPVRENFQVLLVYINDEEVLLSMGNIRHVRVLVQRACHEFVSNIKATTVKCAEGLNALVLTFSDMDDIFVCEIGRAHV